MKVLLTGYSGNLGKAVAPHLLSQGYQLRVLLHGAVLDRRELPPPMEIFWGSLSQSSVADEITRGVDAVVHSAWDGRGAADGSMERMNLGGTMQLLDAAERNGVATFIHVSSVSVYGLDRSLWGKTIDENQPFVTQENSLNAYPWTKVLIENELERRKAGLRMNLAIVRPGLLFSDNKAPAKKLIAWKRKSCGLLVGKATNHLPYVHVDDVAEMISLLLAKPPKYAIYNAVPTSHLSVRDFLKRWGRHGGREIAVIRLAPAMLRILNWGGGKLKKALGRTGGADVNYQIMTGIRDIRYSADRAVKELGWRDRRTNEIVAGDVS
ncbi:MAG TPA: NAD(P)-dependent oxidoreductase [Sedimentisphaerales bacterium]|jgi:nucleoside-diphosphate-sugar epimerase|nr:NAD(P)-dependent oxidoreductase [Sedimentisphaerales bacterium]HNU29424.1 NAD(P)-dependent oxidoreductase [Sedimentisphaerales bacterium]